MEKSRSATPPLQPSSSSSSNTKRSFHGRKLQYQEKIVEQSTLSLPASTTTLTPTYLTTGSTWKMSPTTISANFGDIPMKKVERNK
jgi:hypothetical protein